jgi:hypothetical protein
MPIVSSDIFLLLLKKLAGKKEYKYRDKKDGYDAKWHKVPFRGNK